MIVEVPTDTEIIEMTNSLIWFDKDNILYSVPREKPPVQMDINDIKNEMEKLRKLTGGKKVCMIVEAGTQGGSPPKEQRDLIAGEISSVTKAMAIISSSPLSRMIANLFFSFKPPSYPYKMFANLSDARSWIRQYL